ncbi:MAG TPA: ABC transporter permease [Gemmatimonadales bacterium]|nr:ABC transporter permease [Gemmatimonadales bacterium]
MTPPFRPRLWVWRIAVAVGVALFLALVGLPLVALVVRVPPGDLIRRATSPLVLQALKLSLFTSVTATVLVAAFGLPVAYVLATRNFPGRRLLETLVELPMVIPPTVAGVGLLLAFGRAGLAGGVLSALGLEIPFTTLAVVIAEAFVAMPFFVSTTAAGLREVEPRYREAAVTLGATPPYAFRRVLLPLAMPSLIAGGAMTWARALGEFGATITFAGNLPGSTQTLPLAVYIALQSDVRAAVALSVILLIFSFALLLTLRSFSTGWHGTRIYAHSSRR